MAQPHRGKSDISPHGVTLCFIIGIFSGVASFGYTFAAIAGPEPSPTRFAIAVIVAFLALVIGGFFSLAIAARIAVTPVSKS